MKGRKYVSDKIHIRDIEEFTFWESDRSKVQELVDKYPTGEIVTVYYDPDDPNNCALEPGLHVGNYLLFLICIILLLILLLMVYMLRQRIFNEVHSKSES